MRPVSSASYFATPQTCLGFGCTLLEPMPSPASSDCTSLAEGRPSGEPKMSRTTAVTPQPMARLPTTLTGSP